MGTVFVLFSDETNQVISTAFAVQQDPPATPIDINDPRWKTYFNTLPANAQTGWPVPS